MSVTTDFDLLDTKFKQVFLARKYRSRFANIYNALKDLDAAIQADKDTVEFGAIPSDARNALRSFWQDIIQRDIAEIEANSDYMEMIDSQQG